MADDPNDIVNAALLTADEDGKPVFDEDGQDLSESKDQNKDSTAPEQSGQEPDKDEETDSQTPDDEEATEAESGSGEDSKTDEAEEPDTTSDDKAKPDEETKPEPDKAEVTPSPDEERQSRKERRAERKKDFLESVRHDKDFTPKIEQGEDYEPLDYEKKEDFDTEELKADRDKTVESEARKAASARDWVATQERYRDSIDYENKLLLKDPRYAFMDPSNEDAFNEDRASTINEMFLQMSGYEEVPYVDPKTGAQAKSQVFKNPTISYRKFVENFVDKVDSWSAEAEAKAEAETAKKVAKQRSRASVRPGGSGRRRGLGNLQPGDILGMDDEEYDRNRDQINEQIMSQLK